MSAARKRGYDILDDDAEEAEKMQIAGGDMQVEIVAVKRWEDLVCELGEREVLDQVTHSEGEEERSVADVGVNEKGENWAWDDVNGKFLEWNEELEYMKQKGIWVEVDRKECAEKTGKAPVTVKWVDTDKGTTEEPLFRSRLVARDFRKKDDKDRQDLFAATPPWS
jgi:hypothetical protein